VVLVAQFARIWRGLTAHQRRCLEMTCTETFVGASAGRRLGGRAAPHWFERIERACGARSDAASLPQPSLDRLSTTAEV